MLHLEGLKTRPSTPVIAQWLVALFFLQTLMPLQAHSRLDTDRQGTPVVICTLQGDTSVMIDFGEQGHQDALPSAALLFSDLLNDFSPGIPALQPPALVLSRIQLRQDTIAHAASPASLDASSRAPPRA